MSTFTPDAQHDETPKAAKCAACPKPSIGRIWLNTEVCGDCYADWHDRTPNEGALDAKYGHPATLAEQTVSYERFTGEWLKRRRTEVRPLQAVAP